MDENQQPEQPQEVEQPQEPAQVEPTHDAEPVADAAEATHETILKNLLLDLEGLTHMSKTEVEGVVQKARDQYAAL